ncbi:MAG TPA: tetratricopeptide repeat protein, partial [Myxococcales bacterium]|nr:tetratricopeptide repeat protein [Myxococcales bacterium]
LEGELLEARGQHAAAVRSLNAADTILAKGVGPETADLIDPLGSLASADVALGRWKDAIPLLDRALEIAKKHRPYAGQVAAINFAYAKAMLAKHDKARASALLADARAELEKIPWKKRQLDALNAWAKAKRLH